MGQRRYPLCLLLSFLIGAFPVGVAGRGRDTPTYDGQVDFGAQLLHSNEGCLFVDGHVTSGDFFEDLRRVNLGGRFEYLKRGRVVTEYPDSLTTSVRVVGNQCSPVVAHAPSAIFHGNSYALKFEVSWKDGMNLRPAALSPVAATCNGFNSVTIPDKGFTVPSVTCQLTVEGKGVPLGDHLIVSVFTPDGEQLTRLSAAP
jgi:prepilin-type processing-associated H-X9-DG protein